MKKETPPYPDPHRVRLLSDLIDKYREHLLLVCLKEGISKKDIIAYATRLCALKHLDELLEDPCPMKLISEVEDLAEYRRLCVHQQRQVDRLKYGRSDLDDFPDRVWSQGLI
jgi:hypothetical protein|tara:strand:- start:177 stop:512 length:336 start_codon:yes stop_codon:yes gene_type:complete